MSKEFRLGLFIVAALCVLSGGIFMIGSREMLFTRSYTLRAQFQNVAGLTEGGDVRIGGVHEGTITRIVLPTHPDGLVTVVMSLGKSTRDVVNTTSVATIKSDGLLGDKYMEVSFGTSEGKPLANGGMIAGKPTLDISDVVAKTNQLIDTTAMAMNNIVDATGGLKSITGKIDQGKGSIGALVNDKTVYQQAAEGTAAFNDNMEALKHNFLLKGFFKNRGYEDDSELTKNAIQRLPGSPPAKTFNYDPKQLFDKPDTAKLKNQKLLTEAGMFLQDGDFGLAVVTASTSKGGSAKNRELTQARSAVVRQYLADNFHVTDARLKNIGLGETPDGDQVQILVYPKGVAPPVARAQATTH